MIVPVVLAAACCVAPSQGRFERALVSSEGLDGAAFDEALALRLPDVELLRTWELGPDDAQRGGYVFVHVSREDQDVAVELITADGRAFVRRVEGVEDAERIAASFVVSLVASIELEEVRADRQDVAAPATATDEEVERAVIEARGEEAAQDVVEEPEELEQPAESQVPTEPKSVAPAEQEIVPPRWGVDVTPSAAVVLGMVPVGGPSALAAGGGALHVHGRSPQAWLVGADVRVAARTNREHTLIRTRVSVSLGHVWTWSRAELAAGGLLGAEGWSLYDPDQRVSAGELGAQSMLVASSGWVDGGARFEVDRGRLRAVRLGARVELGGAFAIDDGARAVQLRSAADEALFRLGGLEVSLGAAVTFILASSR